MNEIGNVIDFIYVDIDDTPVPCETTPETLLLQKDKLSLLSDEAKQVLDLLMETPNEIINLCIPNYKKKVSKNHKEMPIGRIRIFLMKKLNWKFRKVLSAIEELREFVKN